MENEIIEKIERVFDMFETSFIYMPSGTELILHKKWNIYFLLSDITNKEEFDYKMLSCLSYYTAQHHYKKTEQQYKWALNRARRWFRYDFSHEDLQKIYQKLGNRANKTLGLQFIKSNFDMALLNNNACNGH